MKTISQIQTQRIPTQDWRIAPPYVDRATRLYHLARDIAEEVYATIAGIFEMPLRKAVPDKHLDRLDDHLLKDIGRQ